jgi:hypothetical protein
VTKDGVNRQANNAGVELISDRFFVMAAPNSGLALPDLLRGLVFQHGWSSTTAAQLAGTSPVAVENWLTRMTPAALTWLRLMAAFQCKVLIVRADESWHITAPPMSKPQRERSRETWRHRRFLHYIHAIAVQNKSLKRMERETRAHAYVASEEQRILGEIDAARARMTTVLIAGEIESMRVAVRALVDASHITADHLVFASGVSFDATSLMLRTQDDGRLSPLRCLLAALDARLEIHLPSGNRVVIARMAAPDMSNKPLINRVTPTIAPQKIKRKHKKTTARSSMDQSEILRLYDSGLPITQIAQQANISRQRVHALAKARGRTMRRVTAADARKREAADLLS